MSKFLFVILAFICMVGMMYSHWSKDLQDTVFFGFLALINAHGAGVWYND